MRTFNERVGVHFDNTACGTLLEAAKRAGRRVGIVVKSALFDASPAGFSAHSSTRGAAQFIAGQQIRQGFDVLLGGGATGYSFRYGGNDSPLQYAQKTGYHVVTTREQLASVVSLPVLGLFAPEALAYDIDRAAFPSEPSLADMTVKALELLQAADTDGRGFVLFVEGSLVDMAAHSNDAAAQVREVLGYDETVRRVVDWTHTHASTLMVSLSDHATGGLVLGVNYPNATSYPSPYVFHVSPLVPADMSLPLLALTLKADASLDPAAFVTRHTGLTLSVEQAQQLAVLRTDPSQLARQVGAWVARQCLIEWVCSQCFVCVCVLSLSDTHTTTVHVRT